MKNWEHRPHQQRTLEAVRGEFLRGHRKVVIQAPCGAGKTYMGGQIIQGALAKGYPVLWMADMIQLVDQPAETFADMDIQCQILRSGVGDLDDMHGYRVAVASKDSLYSWCIKQNRRLPWEGQQVLICVDEGHISSQETVWGIVKRYFDANPECWVICATATPALPNGDGLGGYYDSLVVGATYHELEMAKLLCPLRVYAPRPSDLNGNVRALVGDAWAHWSRWSDGRQTIVFARTVAHSQALAEKFQSEGVNFQHIDAETPEDERKQLLDSFRTREIRGLSNVDIFGKGADLPVAKCVLNVAPTKSLVRYRQRNRIQRPHNGQSAVWIDMSGSIYGFGVMPNEDIQWKWQGNVRDTLKEKLESTERVPIVCKSCWAVRNGGAVCPDCGHRAMQRRRVDDKVVYLDGELEHLTKPKLKKAQTYTASESEWRRVLGMAANSRKQLKYSAALAIYKNRTGQWPSRAFQYADFTRDDYSKPVAVLLPQFVRVK